MHANFQVSIMYSLQRIKARKELFIMHIILQVTHMHKRKQICSYDACAYAYTHACMHAREACTLLNTKTHLNGKCNFTNSIAYLFVFAHFSTCQQEIAHYVGYCGYCLWRCYATRSYRSHCSDYSGGMYYLAFAYA